MARTISQIYDAIVAEKNTKAELANLVPGADDLDTLKTDILTNPSAVAVWRLWAFITAASIWTLEKLQDSFKADVEASAAAAIFGTAGWWVAKLKEFQEGDPLIEITVDGVTRLGYEILDPAKQIITRAAIVDQDDGSALIKVAKDKSPGPGLEALSTPEITQVSGYINQQQAAGAKLFLASLASDKLKAEAEVFYNGVLDVATVTAAVEAAIDTYLAALDFDGAFNRNGFIDAIQGAEGVEDVDVNVLQGRPDAGTFVNIDREYLTSAGYIEVDAAFPLSTTLTYTAN